MSVFLRNIEIRYSDFVGTRNVLSIFFTKEFIAWNNRSNTYKKIIQTLTKFWYTLMSDLFLLLHFWR